MSDLRLPDINRVALAGRLTRDPELRYLQSGTPLCKMGLAVSRKYKGSDGEQHEETLFINVTAWRGTAEYCGDKLRKGRPIIIEGRLKSDEWEDKTTGAKRTAIEVQADRVQALDWDERENAQQPQPPARPSAPVEEPIPVGDIPF